MAPRTSPDDGLSRWEDTLRMVAGVEVPDRETVVAQRWLQMAPTPPTPGDVLVVDTDKTKVYFRATDLEGKESPLSWYLNLPDQLLGPAVRNGRYDGLAVDPRTFTDAALAIERVSTWLWRSERQLTHVTDALAQATTGFQGTAAGAFRDLVNHLLTAFSSYYAQLNRNGPSGYADAIAASGTGARYFLSDLWNAHQHWRGLPEHAPLGAVTSVLRDAAVPNAVAGRAELPATTRYGPVAEQSTWDAVEAAAKQRWLDGLAALDTGARTALRALTRQYQQTTDALAPLVDPAATRNRVTDNTTAAPADPEGSVVDRGTSSHPVALDSPQLNLVTGSTGPGLLADAAMFTPSALDTVGTEPAASEATSVDNAIGRSVVPPSIAFLLPLTVAAGAREHSGTAARAPVGLATIGRPERRDEPDVARLIRSGTDDDDPFGVATTWVPDGPVGAPQANGLAGNNDRRPEADHDPELVAVVPGGDVTVPSAVAPESGVQVGPTIDSGQSTPDGGDRGTTAAGIPPHLMLGTGADGTGGAQLGRLSWAPEDQRSWGTDAPTRSAHLVAALGRSDPVPASQPASTAPAAAPSGAAAAFPGTVTTPTVEESDPPAESRRHR